MAKPAKKEAASYTGKRSLYKIEGDKLVRTRKTCPKCGDGIFLAEHKDRLGCGKCGYTEFKGQGGDPKRGDAKPEVKADKKTEGSPGQKSEKEPEAEA